MPSIADGTIVKIDNDKQLVFGWASVIKDTQDKILLDRQDDFIDSEEELEKAAYSYVLKSRDGGEMHIRKGVSTMVESVVLSKEKQQALGIPAGIVPIGWWVGFKVNDTRVWNEVKKGGYIGFSVHGTGQRHNEDIALDKITEVEKCACEPVKKYNPNYWSTMRKAQIAITNNAISKGEKSGHTFRGNQWTKKTGKKKFNSEEIKTDPAPVTPAVKGNIDLSKWNVRYKNPDGSTSTIKSFSFSDESGYEIIVPTFTAEGKKLTEEQAIEQYYKTNKHLGKFKNPKDAVMYAKWLHRQEAKKISKGERPGHPFRGNQWTRGKAGAGTIDSKSSGKKKIKRKELKAKSVEEGIKRILAGENVELPDIEGAHTLVKELAKMAQDAEKRGDRPIKYDLCKVSVKGANAFCGGNKGIPRDAMPQAKGSVVKGSSAEKLLAKQNAKRKANGKEPKTEVDGTKEFLAHMKKSGISASSPKAVRSDKLKATQQDMNGEKVGGMMTSKNYDPSKEPIFVSRDGYVVDGHHRWAATLGKDMQDGKLGNNHKMNVIVLDAPISRIIKEANAWTDSFGIKRKTVGK